MMMMMMMMMMVFVVYICTCQMFSMSIEYCDFGYSVAFKKIKTLLYVIHI
jgi:hypothetical protein